MIIFELNTRLHGKPFDQISDDYLKNLSRIGFDWIWMMGIWRISPTGREISKKLAPDFEGSPYALLDYKVNPDLGGEGAFRRFVSRAHSVGLKVMVDFVPNHMAVDSPLIDSHPEYFIHSNHLLRQENPEDFFYHRVGKLAHGKDPYFPGWTDTVQFDYVHPGTRAHQIEVLKHIATLADGVRCDMAMLVLREQIKEQWFPKVGWSTFETFMPKEFWSQAIEEVKQQSPDFVFMAEVYWDKEYYLQYLGFDLTYNKKLYDMLAHSSVSDQVATYLNSTPNSYLAHSVHFLENHDEERASEKFSYRTKPVAILSYLIPGAVFVYDGQMEGFKERTPVQRIKPLQNEIPDRDLKKFYERLLSIAKDPIFRQGDMYTIGSFEGIVLFCRQFLDRLVLVGVRLYADDYSPELYLPTNLLRKVGKFLDLWSQKEVVFSLQQEETLVLKTAEINSWNECSAFILEVV